jgi:hypothetical protein
MGETMHCEDNGCGEKINGCVLIKNVSTMAQSAGKKGKHVVVAQIAYRLMIEIEGHSTFIHRLQNRLEGGGERGERCHPSDLLCLLTVIWSGAPTDSLGGTMSHLCLQQACGQIGIK